MAYQKQLIDAKDDTAIKNISGVSTDSAEFVALVNEAQRRLMKRGNFYGMTQTMQLVFQGNCLAWPREVGTVLGIRKCNSIIPLRNNWYQFTPNFSGASEAWEPVSVFEDINPSPIFNPIYGGGNGVKVTYIVSNPNDIGKTCTIYGRKYGYQPLQEKSGSVWVDGLTTTAIQGGGVFEALGDNLVAANASYSLPTGLYSITGLTIGDTYVFYPGANEGGVTPIANDFTAAATTYSIQGRQKNHTLPVSDWNVYPVTARLYPTTPVLITEINAVVREATEGMAYLYQYDATAGTTLQLAAFYPGDTNPIYRRSVIRGFCERFRSTACDSTSSTTAVYNRIEVLCKLKFIEAKSDRDWLFVDDFDALKFAIQAIKCEEANDHQTAETLISKAIRELNFGDRDKMPNWQTSIAVNTMSSNHQIYNPM